MSRCLRGACAAATCWVLPQGVSKIQDLFHVVDICGVLQDDGHIPNTVEKQIFETLVKIRQRDSSIYDSNTHFFKEPADPDSLDGTGSEVQSKKASKPMRLKDVIAQQVRTCAGCHHTSHCAQYCCYAYDFTIL